MSEQASVCVIPTRADQIDPRNIIWAPDDCDWFKVHRVACDGDSGVIFYRADGSEATFSNADLVLARS